MSNDNLYNDVGIPTPIFKILQKNMYQGALVPTFASVTELTLPPKIFWGQKKIKKLIRDGKFKAPASSQIYSMEGSYRHLLFEHGLKDNPDYVVEKRLYHTFIVDDVKYLISGESDCNERPTQFLYDYKEMKSISWLMNLGIGKWKTPKPDMFCKYWFQQNMYFFMCNSPDVEEFGVTKLIDAKGIYNIKKIFLLPVLRDWTPLEKLKNRDLPMSKYAPAVEVPIWTKEELLQQVEDNIRRLIQYKDSDIDDIPECNKEERWESPTTYPVVTIENGTRSKACSGTAKFTDKYDAEKWISNKITTLLSKKKPLPNYKIEVRKANPKRCTSGYCSLSQCSKCNWWRNNQATYFA